MDLHPLRKLTALALVSLSNTAGAGALGASLITLEIGYNIYFTMIQQ